MLLAVFSVAVCILCAAVGWTTHKFYLRRLVYRPTRGNILRYTRRYPRRLKMSKALRKINRKTSLVRKAERAFEFDSLFADHDAF